MNAAQWIVSVLGIAAAVLVVPSCLPQDSETRMKVHMAIDTPHGVVEGASAVQLNYSRAPAWYPTGTGNRNGVGLVGEAPFVDLGDGRLLIMLVEDPWGGRRNMLALGNILSARPQGGEIREQDIPTLVTFRDPKKVTSIARVAPDALAATFGAGYALRRVWIEPTSEAPRFGQLERVLPFRRALEQPGPQRLHDAGIRATMTDPPPNDPRYISWSAFQQGGPR